jgi:hypothetical protein
LFAFVFIHRMLGIVQGSPQLRPVVSQIIECLAQIAFG